MPNATLLVLLLCDSHMSHIIRKPVFWVFDQVRNKLGYTATEDRGLKFRIKKVRSSVAVTAQLILAFFLHMQIADFLMIVLIVLTQEV